MQQRKYRYSKSKDWNKFARYKAVLDPADTIYAANYLLGYFRQAEDAPELMRLQKEEDLKQKGLWGNEFKTPFLDAVDASGGDWGINVYAVGSAVEGRKKQPDHKNLLDLTSSLINSGGWQCFDFVVTFTRDHQVAKFLEGEPPHSEFVLGFIRFDSGVLNNRPLQEFLGQTKITGNFANQHLLTAKVIVPTQPFGSLLRGGKLISLVALSNELRDFFNQRFKRNVVVFYTTSLYGTSKSSSQYDQLDRYLTHIGDTEGTSYPLRMKDPQKGDLIDWMDDRGVSRYDFRFSGSSKSDRSSQELIKYVRHCLWSHQNDKNIKQLLVQFDHEMELWKSGKTEKKKVYVSTYGMPEWDENLIGPYFAVDPEYNLGNLFSYWKKKVFKEKAWGVRKTLKDSHSKLRLTYELLNDQLKNDDFNQVR